MVNITIDGQCIQTESGKTILQVARENGVNIPTLCYHKDLSPTGNCRMCVVEVKGGRFLQYDRKTVTTGNLLLSVLDMYGIHQDSQGDSTGRLAKL